MATTLYRPLTNWPTHKPPTPAASRIGGTFKASLAQTMDELDEELRFIRAVDPVVQVDLPESMLRRDGKPYSDRRPTTPPAVLTFKSKDGHPVTIACDRFSSFDANLRAIALTLHDLRRIDRYGTAAGGEQYRGWAQLPAITITAMNAQQAAEFLNKYSGGKFGAGEILSNVTTATNALRRAMNDLHPDNGGRSGDFALATDAGRVLAAHHGVEKL